MLGCKQSNIQHFFAKSRANISDSSGPIKSIIKLIQNLMITYILTKFRADCLIYVDARVYTKSCSAIQGQTTLDVLVRFCPITKTIRDLVGIYIVAKFGTD